jgi:hypothetical protein
MPDSHHPLRNEIHARESKGEWRLVTLSGLIDKYAGQSVSQSVS